MEFLNNLRDRIFEFWDGLDNRKRMLLASLVGTLVFAVILLLIFTSRTNYVPLYTELSSEDSHMVVEFLEREGIDYDLSPEGDSILVDRNNVHRVRLQMAGEGIPKGGIVGFEIFDTTRLGTTEFERLINFYRALSGELSRTMMDLEHVEMARVQITAPRERLFVQDDEPVQASVLLKIAPFKSLSTNQVRAISHLVAGSVDGLKPEKVTIVDTEGNLLSDEMAMDRFDPFSQEATMQNLELQMLFEKRLQHNLEQMLSPVLGFNNFVIRVNARLNFDLREEHSKIYEPVVDDRGVIRSQQIIEESYSGSTADPGGVPGTDPNIPLYESPEFWRDVDQESYEIITNYEISEREISQIYAPGAVEKLSVGVILNEELPQDQLEQVRESVAAAMGFDEERGDSLHISQLSFDDTLEQEMESLARLQEEEQRRQLYLYGAAIGGILLVLIYIVRRISLIYREEEEEEEEELTVEEAEEEELTEEEKEWQQVKKEIDRLISERPQEAANLLKAWLIED